MKKTVSRSISLAIILALALIFAAGCNSGSPPPAGDQPADTPPTAPASGETFHLNISFSTPEQNSVGITESLDRIQELSNGRITMTYYFSWQLSSVPTIVDDLRTGLVDMGIVPLNMHPSVFQHSTVPDIPLLGYPTTRDIGQIYDEAMAAFPILRDEYTNAGLVYYTNFPQPPYNMYTGGVDPIRTPADLAGRRLTVSDIMLQMMIDQNGGAAVAMPFPDLAIGMSTGVTEGGIIHINTMRAFGALDFADTAIMMDGGFVTGVMALAFSQRTWDRLPDDLKQLFIDEAPLIRDNQADFNLFLAENNERWFTEEHGGEMVWLTDSEVALWREGLADVVDVFLDDMYGLGATQIREVYAGVQELVAARVS